MNRLQGGPYYELSFLVRNQTDQESLLQGILADLSKQRNFKILHLTTELNAMIQAFVAGEVEDDLIFRSFDINAQLNLSGNRKLRLFIAELSNDLLKINFWFYGSEYDVEEWNQIGLKKSDKPAFRVFFSEVKAILKPILGTIAYEEDCSGLFSLTHTYPNEYYKVENLGLAAIEENFYRKINEFEYCWINGQEFDLARDIEFEMLMP